MNGICIVLRKGEKEALLHFFGHLKPAPIYSTCQDKLTRNKRGKRGAAMLWLKVSEAKQLCFYTIDMKFPQEVSRVFQVLRDLVEKRIKIEQQEGVVV